MGSDSVVDMLTEKVIQSNISELAVIINGRYLTRGGKLIYVSCNAAVSPPVLNFYAKENNPITSSYSRKEIRNAADEIASVLHSNILYGIELEGKADIEKCVVEICAYNRLLIIEGQLYASVRKVIESGENNVSFTFSGQVVPAVKVNQLKDAFLRQSYSDCGDLIYSKKNGRFTNKMFKHSKFYAIQKAFVPVFIDYQKVFNPFRLKNSIVKETALFLKAVKTGRYVETGNISGYFLTHREICEVLNMKEFMRFTPSFLYRVFIGLLFPSFDEFPGKSAGDGRHEKLIRGSNSDGTFLKQTVLTKSAAAKIIRENQKILDSASASADEKVFAGNVLKEIQQFETVDSLFVECLENHNALVNIGSPVLDSKNAVTADKLYSYVSKASISFGEVSVNK